MANEFVKTVITTIENEATQRNDEGKRYTSELRPLPIQLSVLSEEAAPVYKEPITDPSNTENAEDLQFQTDNNQKSITLHTKPPIVAPEIETTPQNISATLSPTILFKAIATHTQSTTPGSLSQGVLIQVPLGADSIAGETLTASSTPPESHNRSSKVTQSPTKKPAPSISSEENIYVPLPGTSITPPLTHSSSFESAIGFWRRQIPIPATSDILPSPEPSPCTTASNTGVPLPIATSQKCKKLPNLFSLRITDRLLAPNPYIQPSPLVEQTSASSDQQTKGSAYSNTVANTFIGTSTTQIEVEVSNIQSDSGQGPQPPITLAASKEPDRASRTGRLQTQDSYDSLRTVIRHDDRATSPVDSETSERDSVLFKDLPGIAEEDWVPDNGVREDKKSEVPKSNKTFESLFGGPPREKIISDHPAGIQDSPTYLQSDFQLSQRKIDSPPSHPDKSSTGLLQTPDNTGSHTPSSNLAKSNLTTIAEGEFKDGTKLSPTQIASTTERSFISAEDLLARLAVQPVNKLTSIPDQSIVNPKVRLPSEKKMDLLKRERRRPTPPSLRRAGSQLESPNASSEHIIFGGERYPTPEIKGKGKEAIKRTDIYVCSCSTRLFTPL